MSTATKTARELVEKIRAIAHEQGADVRARGRYDGERGEAMSDERRPLRENLKLSAAVFRVLHGAMAPDWGELKSTFKARLESTADDVLDAIDVALATTPGTTATPAPPCECDAHGDGRCHASADYLVTRKGRRLAVCGRCTLTGDGTDDRDLNPDWAARPATTGDPR